MSESDAQDRRLTEEQAALVADHDGFVRLLAKDVLRTIPQITLDEDELVSAAQEALCRRAREFDPTRGMPFGQFAAVRVRGAMIDAARKENPEVERQRWHERQGKPTPEPTAQPRPTTDGPTYDPLTDEEPDWLQKIRDDTTSISKKYARSEAKQLLRDAIAELPPHERDVIVACIFEEMTLRDAAPQLGISKSGVQRRLDDAYRRLRARLEGRGVS